MDPDLRRQMAAFEAARVEEAVELAPPKIERILAVLDGSDQQPLVTALAGAMAARTGATVSQWSGSGPDVHAEILATASECQLMVVPSPFGRNYAEMHDTLSTAMDLVLTRGSIPVCIARGPIENPDACVQHPIVSLTLDRHRKVAATNAAVALARGGGTVDLLSVVDPEQGIHREELLGRFLEPGDLSVDVLEGLASARAAALTAALMRQSDELDIEPRVHFRVGDPVETLLEAGEEHPGLLVTGLQRDPTKVEHEAARRLVLASRLPVLLV